ncbi:MAG: hypothetical protein ABL921_28630 [Pirellula sp.]
MQKTPNVLELGDDYHETTGRMYAILNTPHLKDFMELVGWIDSNTKAIDHFQGRHPLILKHVRRQVEEIDNDLNR